MLIGPDPSVKDNTPINFPVKELGTCEVYPQTLIHSPNGRFTAVCKSSLSEQGLLYR